MAFYLTPSLTQAVFLTLKQVNEKQADEYFSFSFHFLLRKIFFVKY